MDNWLKEITYESNPRGVKASWGDHHTFQENLANLQETKLGAVYHLQNYLLQRGVLDKALDIDDLERLLTTLQGGQRE